MFSNYSFKFYITLHEIRTPSWYKLCMFVTFNGGGRGRGRGRGRGTNAKLCRFVILTEMLLILLYEKILL